MVIDQATLTTGIAILATAALVIREVMHARAAVRDARAQAREEVARAEIDANARASKLAAQEQRVEAERRDLAKLLKHLASGRLPDEPEPRGPRIRPEDDEPPNQTKRRIGPAPMTSAQILKTKGAMQIERYNGSKNPSDPPMNTPFDEELSNFDDDFLEDDHVS